MEQYIPKSALVTKIENIRKHYIERDDFDNGWNFALDKVLSLTNSLEMKEIGFDLGDPKGDKSAKYIIDTKTHEVKEVDLEKEVESYWKQCDMTWCRDAYSMIHIRSMLSDIAKHFFELGLKVNKGEDV